MAKEKPLCPTCGGDGLYPKAKYLYGGILPARRCGWCQGTGRDIRKKFKPDTRPLHIRFPPKQLRRKTDT